MFQNFFSALCSKSFASATRNNLKDPNLIQPKMFLSEGSGFNMQLKSITYKPISCIHKTLIRNMHYN